MDEKDVSNYPGLYPRKNGAWYVRKAIPASLKGLYTGDQIRKSLHTSDKKEAIRLYAASIPGSKRDSDLNTPGMGGVVVAEIAAIFRPQRDCTGMKEGHAGANRGAVGGNPRGGC